MIMSSFLYPYNDVGIGLCAWRPEGSVCIDLIIIFLFYLFIFLYFVYTNCLYCVFIYQNFIELGSFIEESILYKFHWDV